MLFTGIYPLSGLKSLVLRRYISGLCFWFSSQFHAHIRHRRGNLPTSKRPLQGTEGATGMVMKAWPTAIVWSMRGSVVRHTPWQKESALCKWNLPEPKSAFPQGSVPHLPDVLETSKAWSRNQSALEPKGLMSQYTSKCVFLKLSEPPLVPPAAQPSGA